MSEWLDAEGHVDRALELFERGRWAEAEAELRKALALNPDQAEWHYNLGLTLEASGRDSEAYSAFSRATELLPMEAQPAVSAGGSALRLGRIEEALRWFDRVVRLDPRNEAGYAGQIECFARLARHDDAETSFYISQQMLEESAPCLAAVAESLIDRSEFGRAEWCLKEALRVSPSIPRVRGRLGRVFAATGRPQRALQMYLRELRDDPGNLDALLDYGDLLFETGRFVEAAEKFRRVLELEPAHAEAHLRLGQIALAMNRLDQAHVEFELVLKLDPTDSTARLCLAETLLRRSHMTEARECLRVELGRFDGAEEELEGPDPLREGSIPFDLPRLGKGLLDAGMNEEARRVLQRAIAEPNVTVETLRRAALAHFRLGEIGKGAAVSRRVLRMDPTCVEAMYNLGLAAISRRRYRVAFVWVRRGLAESPHDDGLRRLRIRVVWEAARSALRRAIGRA